MGSITALALTSGLHEAEGDSWEAGFSLANGGLIMGTTIWSMHFIAMMAVQFPVLINYNIVETILSIGIAIVATALGLYVVSNHRLGELQYSRRWRRDGSRNWLHALYRDGCHSGLRPGL
jgi:diguanylate cyclase